ncbi:MAG: F0F1 ATP synthase subunit A [Rhodothermales bacterium]
MQDKQFFLRVGSRLIALLFVAVALPISVVAADDETGDPDAIGHSADGYYLDLSPIGKFELPRLILVDVEDGGWRFDAFPSTRAALASDRYILGDAAGNVLVEADIAEAISTKKHYLFPIEPVGASVIIDLSITRQLVFVFIAALLVIVLIMRLSSRYRGDRRNKAPRGVFQNLMEVIIIFIRDEIAKPTIGDRYRRYLPYLLTVFLFILIGNLLGLLPWGVTATSNIMVTGTLALFTFFITQFSGTKDYWRHIFWPPGVPTAVKFILVPVEILGLFTKPFALAFRLFGNMVSGHLVILSILGLIFIFAAQFGAGVGWGTAFVVSVPLTIFIYVLKIAVSLIQAYVFTMLSSLFIGLAIEEHEPHEHPDEVPAKGYSGGSLDQAEPYVPTPDGMLRDVVTKPG